MTWPPVRRRHPAMRLVTVDDRPVIERFYQLYKHDMSEFTDSLPGADGRFKSGRLQAYLDDPNCSAYLLWQEETPIGFVTVGGVLAGPRTIGDFFVVRRARRAGVGADAALTALRSLPGLWEIAFQEHNTGAARFWRQIAATASGGAYREERRPVPGKPHVPPDVWLTFRVEG